MTRTSRRSDQLVRVSPSAHQRRSEREAEGERDEDRGCDEKTGDGSRYIRRPAARRDRHPERDNDAAEDDDQEYEEEVPGRAYVLTAAVARATLSGADIRLQGRRHGLTAARRALQRLSYSRNEDCEPTPSRVGLKWWGDVWSDARTHRFDEASHFVWVRVQPLVGPVTEEPRWHDCWKQDGCEPDIMRCAGGGRHEHEGEDHQRTSTRRNLNAQHSLRQILEDPETRAKDGGAREDTKEPVEVDVHDSAQAWQACQIYRRLPRRA